MNEHLSSSSSSRRSVTSTMTGRVLCEIWGRTLTSFRRHTQAFAGMTCAASSRWGLRRWRWTCRAKARFLRAAILPLPTLRTCASTCFGMRAMPWMTCARRCLRRVSPSSMSIAIKRPPNLLVRRPSPCAPARNRLLAKAPCDGVALSSVRVFVDLFDFFW